ncbi:MAG: DUF4376 domain-containing protein [Gammaproteobacteria bacterium]|nr:DUF4376 domain-containing protein [Gammaproteobacteria bacterium]MBU1978603.1 DUF4376 domain-containing protein [Gammaproteobacteria bacterium]
MVKINVSSSLNSTDFTAQLHALGLNVYHYNNDMHVDGTPSQVSAGIALASTYNFKIGQDKDKGTAINLDRAKALVAPVLFNGNTYDADDYSVANLTATVAAFNAGVPIPSSFTWRTSDNQDIAMTLPQLISLAGAVLTSRLAAYKASWAAKAAL